MGDEVRQVALGWSDNSGTDADRRGKDKNVGSATPKSCEVRTLGDDLRLFIAYALY
jgi:hypothetical protein